MISYLFKLFGTSALLALIIIYASEHAHAAPVKVEFSGHVNPLLTDTPLNVLFQGNVIYETEITSEVPEGSRFSGSFIYDPLALATTYPLSASSAGYGLGYVGLISSLAFDLERAGGGYFSSTLAGGITVINDQPGTSPYGPTYTDTFIVSFGILSPDFPGIPEADGSVGFVAALNFSQFVDDPATSGLPDILSSYSPPLDLTGIVSGATTKGAVFYLEAEEGFIGLSGSIDEFTVRSVPAPASIGLFLLGLGYIARRRLKA